jgi:hypothetical protein
MEVWFIFSLVAILLAIISKQAKSKDASLNWYLLLLAMWLGLFISVGGAAMADNIHYSAFYRDSNTSNIGNFFEIIRLHFLALLTDRVGTEMGYVGLNILFNNLGFTYVGFLFVYSTILNLFLLKVIYKTNYPIISVILFISSVYFTQEANLIRQMMAVSIFMFSTKYIIKGDFVKYLTFIFLGSLIHFSALLLIPVYFLRAKLISKQLMLITWVLSILSNVVISIFPSLISLLDLIVPFYNLTLASDSGVGTSGELNLMNNFWLLLIIVLTPKIINDKQYSVLLNIFFIGVILGNLTSISLWFHRVSFYFLVISVVVIPYIIELIGRSKINNLFKVKNSLKLLFGILIAYHIFLLFSFAFRSDSGSTNLGTKMYKLEIFK